MLLMRFTASKVEVVFHSGMVTVGTTSCGRDVYIDGKFRRMRGDYPGTPCYVTVTPSGVTVEDTANKRLEIQLADLEISGDLEDEWQ